MKEMERLQKAIAWLKYMRLKSTSIMDKRALAVAIEHMEARLMAMKDANLAD